MKKIILSTITMLAFTGSVRAEECDNMTIAFTAFESRAETAYILCKKKYNITINSDQVYEKIIDQELGQNGKEWDSRANDFVKNVLGSDFMAKCNKKCSKYQESEDFVKCEKKYIQKEYSKQTPEFESRLTVRACQSVEK